MNAEPLQVPPPPTESLDDRPSLILGLIGGTAAMLIAAGIWGAITYFTNYKIGWVAIGVGFAVGFAVRGLGRGTSFIFGLMAAGLSLIGCMLGNLLFYCGILAREFQMGFFDVLGRVIADPGLTVDLFKAGFEVMDIVFYGLAIYFGFRVACNISRKPSPRPV